jgi:hypothetical protein
MCYLSIFYYSMQIKALSTLCILFRQYPCEEVVHIVPKWVFFFLDSRFLYCIFILILYCHGLYQSTIGNFLICYTFEST